MFDFTSGIPVIGDILGTTKKDEAKAQIEEATKQQTTAYREAMAKATGATEPWSTTGQNALNELWRKIQAGPGDFYSSPEYNWRVGEGVNALQKGAASKGRLLSGSTQKALMDYGQKSGASEYDNWLNNWYKSLTPYGNLSQQGLGAATNASNILYQGNIGMGQANAAGTMGQANTDYNTSWSMMSPNEWWGMTMGSGNGLQGFYNTPQQQQYQPQSYNQSFQDMPYNSGGDVTSSKQSGNALSSIWSIFS